MSLEIVRNGPIQPREIEDLRAAVGWDRAEGTYEKVLGRVYAYYTIRGDGSRLVAFVSVLSDGVADAYLCDLLVHPEHQRRGLGTRLVKRVIADIRQAGIQCVQVTFNPHLEPFYAQCGFHITQAGIIDFKSMAWTGESKRESRKRRS